MSIPNTRNFAQSTNLIAGSDSFDLLPFYLQTINIPGVSYSHPEIGGRFGTRMSFNADSVTFGDLSFTALVDEEFLLYNELMTIAEKQLDFNSGAYENKTFQFWIAVLDSKGDEVIKWTFENAKIESIGDLQYDYSSIETNFSIDLTLKFDTFSYKLTKAPGIIPTLMV